jgi:hypothetical protein
LLTLVIGFYSSILWVFVPLEAIVLMPAASFAG